MQDGITFLDVNFQQTSLSKLQISTTWIDDSIIAGCLVHQFSQTWRNLNRTTFNSQPVKLYKIKRPRLRNHWANYWGDDSYGVCNINQEALEFHHDPQL